MCRIRSVSPWRWPRTGRDRTSGSRLRERHPRDDRPRRRGLDRAGARPLPRGRRTCSVPRHKGGLVHRASPGADRTWRCCSIRGARIRRRRCTPAGAGRRSGRRRSHRPNSTVPGRAPAADATSRSPSLRRRCQDCPHGWPAPGGSRLGSGQGPLGCSERRSPSSGTSVGQRRRSCRRPRWPHSEP